MEAAHIAWRPLGQLLVEQGMLTERELELALARQQETGKRLGETLVACGFVSGPELASALAAQYGIELTTETGFGTGLRSQIQRRHESDRKSGARLSLVPDEHDEAPAADEASHGDAELLAQLEEQWAKLAAAEAALAERDREIAELREESARLRDRRDDTPPPPEAARVDGHLVFARFDGRYQLVACDGPPPRDASELTLPDLGADAFVVVGSRPSPLPRDPRPCVVVERLD